MMAPKKQQVAIAILALAGVLVLIVVGVGTYGYQRYYVPLVRPLMFVTASGQLEQTLRAKTPFQPPQSGALTPEQWTRFCDVESAVEAAMGQTVGAAARQRDALKTTADQKAGTVPLLTAIAAFREIGPVYLKAKQAQVEAMNRAGFSMEEYRWVRRQVFLGAGLVLSELDVVGMRTAAQEKRDGVDVKTTSPEPAAVTANGTLVSARRPALDTWLALAFFDL
jgi:hypothetical protein